MTICFFGIYDKNYSRNRIVINGFLDNNVKVIECNDRTKGFFKYLKLIYKYLKIKEQVDYIWVAWPGQFCLFLAKIISRKKIIFDCFTSHYQGLVEDRKVVKEKSFKAKINFWLDKYACQLADLVLLDTNEHIDYFVKTFNLPKEKFYRLLVGSDDSIFFPRPEITNQIFTIHWHGYYIPLQGTDIIIQAAKILKDQPDLKFNLIGRGQGYLKTKDLANSYSLNNINFIDPVKYEELAAWVTQADICLGIFGQTKKATLVIPNKVYEAMACGKPLITAETPAVKELLTNYENVLFCQLGDPDDLAKKILELKNNSQLRKKIAENGYQLFKNKLTPKILIHDLIETCKL